MGSPALNARAVRSLCASAMLIVASSLFSGCDTKTDKGTISASAFGAAQLKAGGVRALTSKLDLLRTIFPDRVAQVLEDTQADAQPIAKVSADLLALFESRSGSINSVDVCRACSGGGRGQVRLHYTRIGLELELDEAGAVGPVISDDVPAIPLSNGWVLAFEEFSRSIVALQPDAAFRPAPANNGNHANFGRGNGLVLSLVISGLELQRQLGTTSVPRVTRMYELRDGRILLFFQEVFRELHVLNVRELEEIVDFDLDEDTAASERPRPMLRGSMVPPGAGPGTIPDPFLTFDDILSETQGLSLDIDSFQPVRVPSDGSVLIYDTVRSVFLRLFESGVTGFGSVVVAASSNAVTETLLTPAGPFAMSSAWHHPSRSEILIVEERTNTILGYDFRSTNPDTSLRVVVDSIDLVSGRRDPTGDGVIVPGGGQEPVLLASQNDLQSVGQRLLFDRGRDELIAIAYSNGVVVIVGKRDRLAAATGAQLVDLLYTEVLGPAPSGGQTIRAWDGVASALLEIVVEFVTLPDVTN